MPLCSGPCNTIQKLCNHDSGLCVYAFFDDSKKCCPVYTNLPSTTINSKKI